MPRVDLKGLIGLGLFAECRLLQAVFGDCEPVKRQMNPRAFVLLDCPARMAAVKYAGDQRTPVQRRAEIQVRI